MVSAVVRRWAPYALFSAGVYLTLFLFGSVAGAESAGGPILPVRGPGDPVIDLDATALFLHNLDVTGRMTAGFLTLGVVTLYHLGINGLVHGSVFEGAAASFGLDTALVLFLPHGVFELSALWLGGAIAFRWVHTVWKAANGDRTRSPFGWLLVESVIMFTAITALLFVAALVEAHVTIALA